MKRHATSLIMSIILGTLLWYPNPAAAQTGFELKDNPEKGQLDILLDGSLAGRYMYAHDTSTPATLLETYKPYCHVYDADGKTALTKGSGGQYTHHRGIFIGWNKIGHGGKTYDRWHMKGGEIVHQKFLEQDSSENHARFVSLTHWNDSDGKPIVVEERTMIFLRMPSPARLGIGFSTKLTAPNGDVFLGGDPEHSGMQYRPADEVVRDETDYVFPKENADPKKDLDYPWVGETYTLAGKRYSVVHFNHPDNPKETKYSAYRDYGRFGAFFAKEIKSGETLSLRYGILIADGEMLPIDAIQEVWDKFAGAASPSETPKTTVVKSVPKKAKKK